MEINKKIFTTLKDSGIPMKECEIAGQTGIDKIKVSKAIKELVKDNKVNSIKNCYYITKK